MKIREISQKITHFLQFSQIFLHFLRHGLELM